MLPSKLQKYTFSQCLLECPITFTFPSVSTQDEDTDDPATVAVSAIIAGQARISPINEKISPPRPISLDIQTNYHIKAAAEANGKIDREQQTPQEPQVGCYDYSHCPERVL